MQPGADTKTVQIYRKAITQTFGFLKNTRRFDDLLAKSIPIGDGEGFLVPVSEIHAGDRPMIDLFSKWREENTFAYPGQFKVTFEGTTSWLRTRLLDVSDRMLFLVFNAQGRPIGHMGYANALNDAGEMEIDNVVRGDKSSDPGLMGKALDALLNWAEETFLPRQIFLRVFDDNARAVEFYRKHSFRDDVRIPMARHDEAAGIFYKPLETGSTKKADKHFLRMIYDSYRAIEKSPSMILTAGPLISSRETSYALDAARYGWNSGWNGYIKKFESKFAEYVGAKYALSTSSCTGGLHLSLLALGIGPGDEVIVPDITWVATANAVVYVGATPVFADIDPDTWCIDPNSFESLITSKTKAVMPVHLYGHPADMERVLDIARRHKLFVVEDAAPSIGAEFKGKRTGTFGDVGVFSFQGAKLTVTGEGGMIVTNDDALFVKIQSLWDQGRDPKKTFWINSTGLKYKMSNIQAALGLGQLEHVDELIEAKRRIFGWYEKGLEGVPGVKLCHEPTGSRSIYWMSSLLLDEKAGIERDALIARLRERNVDTRPVFPAISQYPIWPRKQAPQPVAKRIGAQAINLPSGVCLKKNQIDYVCRNIREILKNPK